MSTRVTATVVCCILMQLLCVVSQKSFSFPQTPYWGSAPDPTGGIRPPDPLPGLHPGTPLGDFHPHEQSNVEILPPLPLHTEQNVKHRTSLRLFYGPSCRWQTRDRYVSLASRPVSHPAICDREYRKWLQTNKTQVNLNDILPAGLFTFECCDRWRSIAVSVGGNNSRPMICPL